MGSEVYPEGLLEVLRRFARLGRPLLVTENGTATDDDGLRAAALEGHLRALAQAVAEGIDLRGYLHWTLMDNYEWALGPTIRFGLAATDYATQARTPRPHAARYREIATANRWTPPRAAADRQPASAG
jgi:beta-glucosidase